VFNPPVGRVVLVDGHSLAYRAHFALIRNPLRDSQGENTSAVFGFASSLRKLMSRFKPEYAAVVFDAPGPSFRHELFKEYKMQRPKIPDELARQLPIIKQLVSAQGFEQFEEPGVEADDALGAIARRLSAQGFEIYIITSDKDLLQLVDDRIRVYDAFKDVVYDPGKVKERFGFGPERIADYLALCGDAIDNIPGVPGIGEKRAQEIVLKYPDLEAALAQDIRLRTHRDIARASKALTVLRTDLDLPLDLERLRMKPPDQVALIRLFKELEFTSLLTELAEGAGSPVEVLSGEDRTRLAGLPIVGIGLEGDLCWIAASSTQVQAVPMRDGRLHAEILENPGILKVGFDLKPLLKRFRILGVRPKPIADVMVAIWLLDSNRKRYELPELLLKYTDRVIGQTRESDVPAHALALYERVQPELDKWQLASLFHDLEMPLEYVLAGMELRGVKLDRTMLAQFSQELTAEIAGLERTIQDQVGMDFNLRSPQQLSQVLFERLKLKPKRRTKTGYSTDASVLQELARSNPIVAEILKVRELTKLQSTYLEPLSQLADPSSGRVHTSFNQTGTATGRLSASAPNLQNVPIRSELGRKVRQAFIAESGFLLISADYAQIELRVLAEISGDHNLKAAFEQGEDIHTRTACAVLGCTEKEVTPEARRIAKMVNYGLIYGMSDFGLAERLGLPREESKAFIEAYRSLYPGVQEWIRSVVERATHEGLVRTRFGRIRPVLGLQSSNQQVYEATRRAAINAPIQGTAADIIKRAMLAVEQRLTEAGFRGGMVLQVHDELLLEIEQERVGEAERAVRSEMAGAWAGPIPLQVDIGIGTNWAEIH
jgi:DNA polymerase-1